MSMGDQFARLTSLLQTSLGSGGDFIDNLTTWERGLEEYEMQTGDKLPDSIRIAQLLGQAPEPLRNHITLTTSGATGTNQEKWTFIKTTTIDFMRASVSPPPTDLGLVNGSSKDRDRRSRSRSTRSATRRPVTEDDNEKFKGKC